ncbi:MAG: glycosyltransferase family 39 protein, partial [Burkholderiales bacterium]|nr:glycosyltransferase family 39 protein [Anaerolineae bacterium]
MYRFLLVCVILLAFWLRLESLDTLPPALSDDEAVNVIDAFHIARTGVFPLYEDPNRPEPLYRIFLAVGTSVFGQSIWAFRFVTVLLGTLAVAAAAWAAAECLHNLGPQKRQLAALAAAGVLAVAISHITLSRALYRGLQQSLFMLLYTALLMRGLRRGHWRDFALSGFALSGAMYSYLAALAAAGVLAVAISHITLSRALYRGLQQSLFMLLYTALLMRGLRRGHWRDFALSGIALSGAMYSYLAALALPASLVAVGLSLLLFQRHRWRMWLPRMVVAGVVLTILMSFIIVLFTRNPVMIIGRAAELREGQGSFFEVQRFEALFAHFFTRGDDNPQYNVESAPFLPPVFNVLFVVGVVGLLTRYKKPSSALIGALFVLSALPEMSTSEIPHGLRASGQFAVFPLVVALGVGWLLQ